MSFWFALEQGPPGRSVTSIHIRFLHASSTAEAKPGDLQRGHSNYIIGGDSSQWRTNISNYGRIGSLESILELTSYITAIITSWSTISTWRPGADPKAIEFAFEGVSNLRLDNEGNLRVKASSRELLLKTPVAYQERAGQREFVHAAYDVHGHSVHFRLGPYDIGRELFIDPVLAYSTYVSGSNGSLGEIVAVDATSAAYIAGFTGVTDFPIVNPYQATVISRVRRYESTSRSWPSAISRVRAVEEHAKSRHDLVALFRHVAART